MTRRSHGLANRPGEPYPATFRMFSNVNGPTGNRTRISATPGRCRPVGPSARNRVDLIGVEPITPILQGSVATIGMQAQVFESSVRESNPVSVLTTDVCCRNTYRPFLSSDPGWNRTSTLLHVTQASSPLDHGIVVSDRGRNRTCKIATLRAPTRSVGR